MTTTQRGRPKVQLAPNVPVQMRLKFVDVWPNNPENNYGASVRLTGVVDGEESVLYPKGKAWAVLKALQAGGAIAPGEYNEDPAEKYSIAVATADVTLVLEQAAGQKYPELRVQPLNGSAPSAAPAAAKGAKAPHSLGGPIPGEEPAAPAATPARPGFPALVEQYRECLKEAVTCAQYLHGKDIGTDSQTVAAIAATLMIERSRRGV